ncbi:hypothetical protein KAR91_20965 [Candidatus Pacearchaeota archaeon]|nr:hypothetical protein [Candidatus Pacearchaeota archaeon]
MGEDIPTLPPGEGKSVHDCLACFAAGETPKYLRVTFVGVTLCPGFSWPNGVDLNQAWWLTSISPCRWEYEDANWLIIYDATSLSGARVFANPFSGQRKYFHRFEQPDCTAFFINGMQLPCEFTDGAWGGTADLT